MAASDLDPEKARDGANGQAAGRDESGSSVDSTLSSPPRSRAGPDNRTRPILLFAMLVAVVAWLAYDSAPQTPATRTPADAVALDAAGGWWNVGGDRYLELSWEGRRATLWDYSNSDSGVESAGTWRATDHTILVEVTGAAGNLTQEYEVIGNDAELFLAPAPVAAAKLMDSWIADHGGQDEEEVDPGRTVSREAVWQPHHHRGHQRLPHHSHSRPYTAPRGA